jgi:nicotinamidase-related amidase
MSTLAGRPGRALLVVDVQTGVVAAAFARDAIVANIKRAVEKARAAAQPVIWIRHAGANLEPGSGAWQIVPELSPAVGETIVEKRYPDAFEDTVLEEILARQKIGRLIVTGAQSDGCICSTLHGAIARGYDAILVSDAHTMEDLTGWGAPPPDKVIAHTNLHWAYHRAPGRRAGVVKTAELDFSAD